MDKERISLDLELELSGESLTGRARNGSGPARGFTGWVGMLAAIDALIVEKGCRDGGPHGASAPMQTAEAADPPQEQDTTSKGEPMTVPYLDPAAPDSLDVGPLRARSDGAVVAPGDAEWDAARQAWNLAVDQRPAAVALPADADDVAAAVDFARDHGLRVAAQGTGHNAGPLGPLEDTLLVKTESMRGVEIDPVGQSARVEAGVLWQEVVEAATAHGLAALHGSSPDVGVVGYSLGGGMGWLARKHGLQSNSVLAVELVTADGTLLRVDRDREPDLFWALRGGGGDFGVVTAMEFRLYPVTEVYGGALVWPWERSEEVLNRWSEWAIDAPDEVTTSARIMQLPPLPEVPEPLRGRQLMMIDGAYIGDEAAGAELLRPLRELEPEIDMFATIPAVALTHIHGDPETPVPAGSDAVMLDELPASAVETIVELAGPGSGSSLLMAELRQLGGALGRPAPDAGALPCLDGEFAMFAVGMVSDPESGAAVERDSRRLVEAMAPHSSGKRYLNFAERRTDARTGYSPDAHRRLGAVKAAVDPENLFRANHPIEPAA